MHVRRGKTGDPITLFDGTGNEYTAEIISCGKALATVRITGSRAVDRELPYRLALAFAPAKAQAMDDIVRQATEIGVTTIQPVYCANSVVHYKDFEQKCRKWRRTVIEACKQCGRNVLPMIGTPVSLAAFLETCRGSIVLMAHPAPDARSAREFVSRPDKHERIVCLIGPEGGFTDEEASLAVSAGARLVSLGPTRLRVETAALALLSAVTSFLR
jgi:16S rRNA (uracil1498-N3)-methyltransferase